VRAAPILAPLALLALLVWVVWPRPSPAEAAQRATYDALRSAAVSPVLLAGGAVSDPRAGLTPDGYRFEADLAGVGHVTLRGGQIAPMPDASPAPFEVDGHPATLSSAAAETSIVWQASGAGYTLVVPGQPDATTLQAIAARVAPLPTASRDAFGFGGDTPLLYLAYLPLFVGFFGWSGGRLLARTG
jgi:hypothetical protein